MSNTFAKIGFVLAFVSVALWFFVFSPLVGDLNSAKRDLEQTRQAYEKKKKSVDRLKKLKEEYKKLDTEIEKVNTLLPENIRFPQLLLEMNKLVVQSGVSSPSINFGSVAGTKEAGLQKYKIDLNFDADYFTLKQFLEKKREEMRLMDIERIGLNPGGEGVNYKVSVELIAYYYNG